MARRVLFIAPNFPPASGAGTNRSQQFVHWLDAFGYEVHVLTLHPDHLKNSHVRRDDGLLDKIPQGVKVYRPEVPAVSPMYNWLIDKHLGRVYWSFWFHRSWELSTTWSRGVRPFAEEIIERENIELIYTSSGPFSIIPLAAKLKRKTQLKWVADLRDPYSDGYMWRWPSWWHWLAVRRMERKYLNEADKVIVNTPAVYRLYKRRNLLPEDKMEVITNGF